MLEFVNPTMICRLRGFELQYTNIKADIDTKGRLGFEKLNAERKLYYAHTQSLLVPKIEGSTSQCQFMQRKLRAICSLD